MNAIRYVVRSGADNVQAGLVPADADFHRISAFGGQDISLSLRQGDIRAYQRSGQNLEIVLADGRAIIIEGYFGGDGLAQGTLFLSSDGYLNEVTLVDAADGTAYAQYSAAAPVGKWSPDDALIFMDGPDIAVAAVHGDEDVGMLAAGVLGGSGLLGALGLGAAGVGAAALVSGDSGGGLSKVAPEITSEGPIVIGGDEVDTATETLTITGTSEPGATVVVTVGEETVETEADDDGNWSVDFTGGTFPADGSYTVTAVVTDPDGTETELDGPSVTIDTTGPDTSVSEGTVSVQEIVNAAEYESGFSVSGEGEPGSTVAVTIEGVTRETTVGNDGSWSVSFAEGELPEGEYTTTVTAVSTDPMGNTTTVTDSVQIDTVPHDLSISTATVESDGTINFAENAAGFTITGASEPGATVTVEIGGQTREAVVGPDGRWSADFPAGLLPPGEYDAPVTATTQDPAGNVTTTGTVRVGTEVRNLGLDDPDVATNSLDGSDVINDAVAGAGFDISGTAEPSSTVMVTLDGVTRPASVDESGNWTARFLPGDIASGEREGALRVDVTDPAGNTDTLTDTIAIDTLVNELGLSGTVAGDGVINTAEAGEGVTVAGQVEPGARVLVDVFGKTYEANVAADGSWSLSIPLADIPAGESTASMLITATDAAGNTSTITEQLSVDMVAPDGPGVVGAFRETGGGYSYVTTETSDDTVSIHQIDASGAASELNLGTSTNAVLGQTDYIFLDGAGTPQSVPDGSELLVTSADAAGNTSSTLVVLDETATNAVDMGSLTLNGFNIDEIDLRLGDQRELTITEDQLRALSENGDQLVVRGGADDTVTIAGAQNAGTAQLDGETFQIYTLGSGANVVVDDEITVIT